MLHQTASSGAMFHEVMNRFQSVDTNISAVVAPDTPGFGDIMLARMWQYDILHCLQVVHRI